MATSCTIGLPSASLAAATCKAVIRFSSPSVRTSPIGSWLPVISPGLRKILHHETQGGSGISHGIGAVKHHEAIVIVVILCDNLAISH